MELGKVQYFENIEAHHHREFINAHNNCILCGSVLELRHTRSPEITEVQPQIKEEAYCTECDLRTRTKEHTLN